MGVDHHVRVPIGKETVEDLRRQAVAFHEIAVQVEVAAIGPEPEGLGPELVHARAGVAVQATIDVVHRDEQEHGGAQRREALRLGAEIAHQRHAAVDALGLTGVDAVVVEEHTTPVGLESLTVEHAVRRDEAGMQRHAVVRLANLGKTQHRREVGCKSLVPRDAVGPAGGLVAIAAFEGGEVGVCVHWMRGPGIGRQLLPTHQLRCRWTRPGLFLDRADLGTFNRQVVHQALVGKDEANDRFVGGVAVNGAARAQSGQRHAAVHTGLPASSLPALVCW